MATFSPCPEIGCGRQFDTAEALLEHWKQKCLSGQGHYFCQKCMKLFNTVTACVAHHHLNHPNEQKITCPGCEKQFARLGSWMVHIDRKDCPRITIAYMEQLREKSNGFARGLNSMAASLEKIDMSEAASVAESNATTQSETSNYSKYLAGRYATSHGDASRAAASLAPSRVSQAFGQLSRGSSLGPGGDSDITTLKSDRTATMPSTQSIRNVGPVFQPNPGFSLDKAQTDQKKAGNNNKENKSVILKHDPTRRDFNAMDYWCEPIGKFKCPHDNCWKSFKSSNDLKNHLKSPAHTKPYRVQCPWCSSLFNETTGLIQHAEAQGKCYLKWTDDYRHFVNMATGGLIDVNPDDVNPDGTAKYFVSDKARDLFGRQKSQVEVENEERTARGKKMQDDKSFWNDYKPDW